MPGAMVDAPMIDHQRDRIAIASLGVHVAGNCNDVVDLPGFDVCIAC